MPATAQWYVQGTGWAERPIAVGPQHEGRNAELAAEAAQEWMDGQSQRAVMSVAGVHEGTRIYLVTVWVALRRGPNDTIESITPVPRLW